jgi:mannose-1-phosphate guanylyltransferase/mannose-6-phosphate isomerase
MLVPVILSGGAGTRLWPVSREAHPKPFMTLPDGESLLFKTARRALSLPGVARLLTITNRALYFSTRDEYDLLAESRVELDYVLEPLGRNTAPAIAAAALHLFDAVGEDAVMLVLAADHLITREDAFRDAVVAAVELARDGYLVTFGIKPGRPETGYGYIELGEPVRTAKSAAARHVSRFVEKPDRARAEEYLASGRFLWNSGMFCFRPKDLLAALWEHAPEVAEGAEMAWAATARDQLPIEIDRAGFERLPSVSIDYAVMERAQRVAVVECDLGWSDIGSWTAVAELQPADDNGNRVVGKALLVDSRECYVQAEDRYVAALGVDNLLIVDTPDALLVADRGHAQEVKQVVERLREDKDELYRFHTTVHRPWGTYTVLEEGDRFKIKRIVVKPGRDLSLQMHHHRSEHWIVVSGTAKVVNGDREFLVRTNESTYIPCGHPHRLSNPGVINLVMIEVQSGEYLREDDIVRFDDRYGRI